MDSLLFAAQNATKVNFKLHGHFLYLISSAFVSALLMDESTLIKTGKHILDLESYCQRPFITR